METLKCSRCGKEKPSYDFDILRNSKRGHQYNCKECTRVINAMWKKENVEKTKAQRVRAKAWRKDWLKDNREIMRSAHRKWVNKNYEKIIAHYTLNNAISYGFVDRPNTCSQCGDEGKVEGHHPDYSKPLNVLWLCMPCHKELHRKLREAA